jgi:hypothetical protein
MMQPYYNQHEAQRRIEGLRRDAAMAHLAAQAREGNFSQNLVNPLRLMRSRWQQKRFAARHAAVAKNTITLPKQIPSERIKPALLMTFTAMHDQGLVSDFDERFIETFMLTLEQEIAHQSCVEAGRKMV